ncbi:MAG: hypothetical protein IPL99_08705 [Candidatus Competibacteraceae bacterium]|nr:hypothetical protein [Candidatus Competibacteraceae bacterium]
MNPLEDALTALERVTGYRPVKAGDSYKARCPCHEDKNPSLSVKMNGRLLLHCFAGCRYDHILAALGLTPERPTGQREIVATYRYRDAAGLEVRQKLRYAPKDFRIRHRGEETGTWIYKAGPGPAVLYRLPELRQAIAQGTTVFIVEGEKDCDRLAAGGLAATTNIEGATKPEQNTKWRREYTAQLAGAARVVLLPDNDPPGKAHMAHIAQQIRGQVADVRVVELPELPAKGDVSDWLNQGHTLDQLQALVATAPAFVAPPAFAPQPDATRVSSVPAEQRRETIRVDVGYLPEAADQAEAALIQAEAGVYQRGYLCRVSRHPTATVRGITRPAGVVLIVAVDEVYLRDLLDRQVQWEHWSQRKKAYTRCNVPDSIAKTVLARSGLWNFPVLTGVIGAPTIRPDGSLLATPGYDPATGLFFDAQGETFPPIPDHPTREQGRAALDVLIREVLTNPCTNAANAAGFAFASATACAAALSAILTALVRPSLPKAPLHLFRACRAGSGKSLLADTVALIATGQPATVFDLAEDDPAEQEKRLLAVFLAGDAVINLDNLEGPLGGKSLAKMLTAETFTGRVLGQSRTVTVPTAATWLATGNNTLVKEDITRRVVLCELDPQLEAPEKREYDRNLATWIPAHRPTLVAAALTALRAYIVAGQPQQPHPVMGSFEDWSHRVRDALTWLGEADPLGDTDKMEDTDPIRVKLRALLLAWHCAFKSIPSTCAEAVARANETQRDETGMDVHTDSVLHETLTEFFSDAKSGKVSSRYMGEFIAKYQRRIECGARFEAAGKYGARVLWRVFLTDAAKFQNETFEVLKSVKSSPVPCEKFAYSTKVHGDNSSSAK